MIVNHYEILGVDENAQLVQITAAWQRLIKKFHPDLNPDDINATKQTDLVNQAYEVLSDSTKRARFDQELKESRSRKSAESTFQTSAQKEPEFGDSQGSFHQTPPFSTQSSETTNQYSYANKSRAKSKQNSYAGLMAVVGIVLGALTAIPIGLFLVWTISGFDPLGIFRLPENQVVENESNENQITPERTPKNKDLDEKVDKGKKDKSDGPDEQSEGNREVSNGDSDLNKAATSQTEQNQNLDAKSSPSDDKNNASGDASTKPTPENTPKANNSQSNTKEKTLPAATTNPPSGKIPVPDKIGVAKAKQDIAEIFKADYEAANAANKLGRLLKLRELANQVLAMVPNEKDPTKVYAVFEVAIDIARQSCFAVDALRMVDQFEQKFAINGMAIRLQLFDYWHDQLPRMMKDPEVRRKSFMDLAAAAKPITDKVVVEKNWRMAVEFSEVLRKLYVAGGDRNTAVKIEKTLPQLKKNLEDETLANKMLADLATNPDQPEKKIPIGFYYCFAMNEWQKGLTYLQESNSKPLSDCATADLEVTPETSEQAGNLWWELTEDENLERYHQEFFVRAVHHYTNAKAYESAKDNAIAKARLEKRIRIVFPRPRITIVKASFGWNKKWTDATDSLRKILERDPPVFVNSARGMGVGDPIPKIRKVTKITYKIDGKQKGITLKAGPNRKYNLWDTLK